MSAKDAITNNTVIIRAAGGPEIIWRTRRMISLGADAELAATIAISTADLHDIERLLDAGCPLELAWTIMEPIDEPVTIVDADADAMQGEAAIVAAPDDPRS